MTSDKEQMQNVQMKRHWRPNHHKSCTAMQNTEGKEAKAKIQTTTKHIKCDAQARTGIKRCSAKAG